jgi:hypothetical protein
MQSVHHRAVECAGWGMVSKDSRDIWMMHRFIGGTQSQPQSHSEKRDLVFGLKPHWKEPPAIAGDPIRDASLIPQRGNDPWSP